VLGFVDDSDGMTSYDLKQEVEGSVGYFWPFPHTQLYDEPKRLVAGGLLKEHIEPGGRRRRVYTITQAGRRALHDWLDEPATTPTRIHDPGLLQLFFAGASGQEPGAAARRLTTLAEAQVQAHQQRLDEYLAIADMIQSGEMDIDLGGCCQRTLDAGLAMERLMVEFWEGVRDDPPTAD